MKHISKLSLTHLIFISLTMAVIAGLGWREEMVVVKPLGDVFMAALKMLIGPIIFFSVASGVASLSQLGKLRRLSVATVAYYIASTSLAILTGLALVFLVHPGKRAGEAATSLLHQLSSRPAVETTAPSFSHFLNDLFLSFFMNPVKAFADMNVLAIAVLALLVGIAVQSLKPSSQGMADWLSSMNEILMKILSWIMWLAPLGLFGLVAPMVGLLGLSALKALGWFIAVVVIGIVIHGFGTLLALVWMFGKRNPWQMLKQITEPLVVAFSTSSSNATIPVTLRCATEKLKVSPQTADLVVPVGATLNMDGTALYEAVAAVFIAELYGISLGWDSALIIFLMAMVTSIGAPGIPSAGMVTMLAVLSAVGLPLEGVALLLTVDRFLDTFRTMVNVEGDLIAACIVDRVAT